MTIMEAKHATKLSKSLDYSIIFIFVSVVSLSSYQNNKHHRVLVTTTEQKITITKKFF